VALDDIFSPGVEEFARALLGVGFGHGVSSDGLVVRLFEPTLEPAAGLAKSRWSLPR
jgi:hypothetical protein